MRVINRLLSFCAILLFFVAAVAALLQQNKVYQKGYAILNARMKHFSISVMSEEKEELGEYSG